LGLCTQNPLNINLFQTDINRNSGEHNKNYGKIINTYEISKHYLFTFLRIVRGNGTYTAKSGPQPWSGSVYISLSTNCLWIYYYHNTSVFEKL